jgi:hypothetical protein
MLLQQLRVVERFGSALNSPAQARFRQATLVAIVGAALSILRSGYAPGFSNNLFHYAILGRLYDLPQFQNDTFIQSLRYFVSGLWIVLSGAATGDNASILLFSLFVASRILFFGGALACASLAGALSLRTKLLFVVLLAFSSMLPAYSYAGGGGLFTTEFTHSEVANGTTLFVLYFAGRGRYAESFAFNGLTFFLNAFMGVWNAVPLGLIIASHLFRRKISVAEFAKQAVVGLALFAVYSFAVVSRTLSNPELHLQQTFDYRLYLREYWPFHFFIDATPKSELLRLFVVFITGLASLVVIGRGADTLRLGLVGFALVWAFGVFAPSLIPANWPILLHLLRVSAEIQVVASVGLALLTASWLEKRQSWEAQVWGPLTALTSTLTPKTLVVVPLLIAASRFPLMRSPPSWIRPAAAGMLALVVWPVLWLGGSKVTRAQDLATANWNHLATWARYHTPPTATFLLPISQFPGDGLAHRLRNADPSEGSLAVGDEIFEFEARRKVWVDEKRGGAVMWWPSYYEKWRRELAEALALGNLGARLTYARSHGIEYVIDRCSQPQLSPMNRPMFASGALCVFSSAAT